MKKLLVVIDYQNDFVSGSLGFQEATLIEDHLVSLIETFHQNNDDVIFTLDTHQSDYLTSHEGLHLPIEHCIEGSEGWQLYGKIKDLAKNDLQIKKTTFGSLELGNYLKDKEYDQIIITGVVSNICVISNAIIIKAALPNTKIIIDKAGIASNDPLMQQKALDIMKNLHLEIMNE